MTKHGKYTIRSPVERLTTSQALGRIDRTRLLSPFIQHPVNAPTIPLVQKEQQKPPRSQERPPKRYTVGKDVVLSSEVEKKVDLIAKKFYATTKKNIHITSGTRTPARQAAAMYNKLAQGDRLTIYRNQKAAQQIRKAYDSAKRSGNSRKEIISAMTEVISLQTKAGVFISKHLKAGAVDVQSKTMSPDEKAAFQEAAKETATSVLLETLPPHFHLQF